MEMELKGVPVAHSMTRIAAFVARRLRRWPHPAICMDVAAWATAKGIPRIRLHDPVLPEVEPHVRGDLVAKSEVEAHRDELSREQSLVVLENAMVRSADGIVQLPDGKVCYQGNWHLPYLKRHPSFCRRCGGQERRIKGNVYSLLCLWGGELYHWFHDVLPRLEFALPHLPKGTKFLLPHQTRAYQLESLRAYGIEPCDIELQSPRASALIARLWFATPLGHATFTSGSALQRVAQRLKAFVHADVNGLRRDRIYVSRREAIRRRVLNEDRIAAILGELGFRIEVCEALPWADQVRLFSNAGIDFRPSRVPV